MVPRLLLFCFLLLNFNLSAQSPPIYSKVEVVLDGHLTVQSLNDAGLSIDHVHKDQENKIDFVVNEEELALLQQMNIPFDILVENLSENYLRMLQQARENRVDMSCGLTNFDEGSMGMYHSYDDMVTHINQMQTLYPEIVQIGEAGKSIEDRTVYFVKISDNVASDESATEGVVYYDAVHHAREPVGLESHLYYMWWLLENYATDPEAKYLIDHREIYFIPIVNPDGYVYNQTTNPNGGGYWRKNRRDDGGGCFGVDLNRNYPVAWGNLIGSSSDPCSDLFHGAGAFSEPETQNVRDMVALINPAIAFSCHTYSDVFLSPTNENFEYIQYDIIADFSSEFIPEQYKGYGSTNDMINYTAAGTAGDYITSQGTPAWIPEIGHRFWEDPADICDRVQEVFPAFKYLSWVAGDYTTFHSAYTKASDQLWDGDVLELVVRVRNKGLTKDAEEVVVTASSSAAKLIPLVTEANLGTLASRAFQNNASQPFQFELDGDFAVGEEIPVTITVRQNGTITSTKELLFYAGRRTVLFSEDCENGIGNWSSTDNTWQVSTMDFYGGSNGITDSPDQNYDFGTVATIGTLDGIDLSLTENPYLEFKAKWSLEEDYDVVRLQASVDQVVWEDLTGKYTESDGTFDGQIYSFNKYWIQERVDLKEFLGVEKLYLRFLLTSDNSRQGDGFYFDDFEVVDYSEGTTVGLSEDLPHSSIYVFPNPHSGHTQLTISVDNPTLTTLTITDLSGQLVAQRQLDLASGKNQESISTPRAGVFFLTIEMGETRVVRKVVGF